MDILKHVAAIIRTYNNNPGIVESVKRAFENGLDLVIVVVNAHDESMRGNVRGWLNGLERAQEQRLVIIEMNQGYSWCNALNAGLAEIRKENGRTKIGERRGIDVVLAVSNEVVWERRQLYAMLAEMMFDATVGVVGTSFEGRENGSMVDLGRSYRYPRNTFMLIRWTALLSVGHFDAACDGFGGMEDLNFIMNMVMIGNFRWSRLDLKIPLIVGKNYNQGEKEVREQAALKKVAAHFSAIYVNWYASAIEVLRQFDADAL